MFDDYLIGSIPQKCEPEKVKMVEFEIRYYESDLLEKSNQYRLNPTKIIDQLKVDLIYLKTILSTEESLKRSPLVDYIVSLEIKFKNCPSNQQLSLFTNTINHLVNSCLDAHQNGTSSSTIFSLLRCFKLRSLFGLSQTAQLHGFLFQLVSESVQLQLKNQLDYALNFDVSTKLPHSSQITNYLTKPAHDLDDSNLIALFSIYFQISKHKTINLHNSSIHLGDEIIAKFKENLDSSCKLFSDGSLQFNILFTELTNLMQINLLAAKIGRAFEQTILLDNQSVLITPFIGCVCVENSPDFNGKLYINSKQALSKAIQDQQAFVMYSDDLEAHLLAKIDRENKVLEAFSSNNLTLYLQPIVDIKNIKIVGAELLLRWSDMTKYSVAPGLTVEILNQSGRGKSFTRWLINSACRYASELKQEHQLNIYLTINLQADDLYDVELPHLLMQSIALWRINPQDIVLEITENGVLEYNDTSKSVIDTLVKNGFRLALDDFGTGYSSLSRLRNMPIEIIKIDQSFVRDIKHSRQDYEIVKSIAMLAKSLGKEVLAEGVEDDECLTLIKKMKIEKCQGYFFSKPMPFEQFIKWAKDY